MKNLLNCCFNWGYYSELTFKLKCIQLLLNFEFTQKLQITLWVFKNGKNKKKIENVQFKYVSKYLHL